MAMAIASLPQMRAGCGGAGASLWQGPYEIRGKSAGIACTSTSTAQLVWQPRNGALGTSFKYCGSCISKKAVVGASTLECSCVLGSRSRLWRVYSNVEDGVKESETSAGEDDMSKEDTQILRSSSESKDPSTSSPSPSPFQSGKISSRIGVNQAKESRPLFPNSSENASLRKPAFTSQPSPVNGKQETIFPGKVSAGAAEKMKFPKPLNVFNQTPSGQSFTATGKRVVDASKEGDKLGKTTKFGQPVVPKNIFDDVRRTPEEIAADAYKFSISPGQLFLIFSFLLIIGLMLATAFLVWKVGAIHYNEY